MTNGGRLEKNGYSLIEVMLAMVVLTFGVLAMAAFTGTVNTQVRIGDERSERISAMQQQMEILRARPFSGVASVSQAAGLTIGRYKVWYTATPLTSTETRVTVYSEGSAYVPSRGWVAVADSLTFTLTP